MAEGFYAFIVKRERIRIRREVFRLPPQEWCPEDETMRKVRLTNVRREDDRTTRTVRQIASVAADAWPSFHAGHAGNWSQEQLELAGHLVFNFGLWRTFGSEHFAFAIGFNRFEDFCSTTQDQVIEAALSCWRGGKLCFTDAYDPARSDQELERKAQQCCDEAAARALYGRACRRLQGLWKDRIAIADTARRTHSWHAATRRLMQVPGFGGTGFLAKELIQDLIHTPVFTQWDPTHNTWRLTCCDLNTWCAVGPGARRGLNRLHRRPTGENAYSSAAKWQSMFLQDLIDLYQMRARLWPAAIDGVPTHELELHDVQFQLCEFDKYERVRLGEGSARPYTPSSIDNSVNASVTERSTRHDTALLSRAAGPCLTFHRVATRTKRDDSSGAQDEAQRPLKIMRALQKASSSSVLQIRTDVPSGNLSSSNDAVEVICVEDSDQSLHSRAERLAAMGFPINACRAALEAAAGDVNVAANSLLSDRLFG